MGITGLLPLLRSIHKQCHLKKFSGHCVGVDAYGWLHRGAVACAVDLALGKPTTKYVDFAMSRVRMLVHFGIKPYLVFDGGHLPSKAGTEKERAARRAESRRLGMELLSIGKTSQAYLQLQKAVDITPEMARQFIEELKISNIDYLVAPYEADPQLVYLEREGIIQAILTEDSDLLVFGAKCLLTKLDQYGECVMISRNDFTSCREISLAGWSDAEFRRMAILSGCDYLASINKMGLKTAHKLVRKHKTIDRIIRSLQFDSHFKIPSDYLDNFHQAELTFLHQWVFCPTSKALVNLTELPSGLNVEDVPFIGSTMDPDIAIGVSRGDLHPQTQQALLYKSYIHTSRPSNFAPGQKRHSVTDNDVKKNRTIEDCFKPKRIPLAELDPNSFTPSPRQQALLRDSPRIWSARSAPQSSRPRATTTNLPHSTRPVSRRAVTDSWSSLKGNARTPKRQRLCFDNDEPAAAESASRADSGFSKFFSAEKNKESPSVRKDSRSKNTGKADFHLWSDDSIEEAITRNPEIFSPSSNRKHRKMAVFDDNGLIITPEHPEALLDLGATTPLVARTPSKPAAVLDAGEKDFRLQAATVSVEEFQKTATELDEHVVAELQDLRQKYSYRAIIPDGDNVQQTRKSSVQSIVEVSPVGQSRFRSRIPKAIRPSPVSKPSPSASRQQLHSSADITVREISLVQQSPVHCSGTSQHFALKRLLGAKGIDTTIGSEDLSVPDSEGEMSASDGEGIQVTIPRLDLARFSYGAGV